MTRQEVNDQLDDLEARAKALADQAQDAVVHSDACAWYGTFVAGASRACESLETSAAALRSDAEWLANECSRLRLSSDSDVAARAAQLSAHVDKMAGVTMAIADSAKSDLLPPSVDEFVASAREFARKIGELAGGTAGELAGGAAGGAIGGATAGAGMTLGLAGWLAIGLAVYVLVFTPAGKKLMTGGAA